MFLSTAVGTRSRKKNGSFESAEPTSPKVTCIGQVRVKTSMKKMKKKKLQQQNKGAVVMRSRSRMKGSGEMSFRRSDQRGEEVEGVFVGTSQNQKWVHFPLGNMCEAVRSFGSEINCFSPCCGGRGPREKVEKRPRVTCGGGVGSCGSAFTRWLLAIEEEKEVGGVVGENDPSERRGSRREVMRDMELVADELERGTKREDNIGNRAEDNDNKGEEDADVLVCVPPRNALLLMRCRSDPLRMSSIANRFWGSPIANSLVETEALAHKEVQQFEEDEPSADAYAEGFNVEDVKGEEVPQELSKSLIEVGFEDNCQELGIGSPIKVEGSSIPEESEEKISPSSLMEVTQEEVREEAKENIDIVEETVGATATLEPMKEKVAMVVETVGLTANLEEPMKENVAIIMGTVGVNASLEPRRSKKKKKKLEVTEGESRRWSFSKENEKRRHSFSTNKDVKRSSSYREKEVRRSSFSLSTEGDVVRRSSFSSELEIRRRRRSISSEKHGRRDVTLQEKLAEDAEKDRGKIVETQKTVQGKKEELKQSEEVGVDKKKTMLELPDCLLLMMYEPKLSMEVSQETWVSTADFIRHHHHRRRRDQQQRNKPKQEEVSGMNFVKEETVNTLQQQEEEPATQPHPHEPVVNNSSSTSNGVGNNNNTRCKIGASCFTGPFVLTRCKSEPMRSSAKMLPDACFWKSRHQPISTAGIGF